MPIRPKQFTGRGRSFDTTNTLVFLSRHNSLPTWDDSFYGVSKAYRKDELFDHTSTIDNFRNFHTCRGNLAIIQGSNAEKLNFVFGVWFQVFFSSFPFSFGFERNINRDWALDPKIFCSIQLTNFTSSSKFSTWFGLFHR